MKEKDRWKQQNIEIELIRIEFFKELQSHKELYENLKYFQDIKKILRASSKTYLSKLGIMKKDKEEIFHFLKEKIGIDFPEENKETLTTAADFIAGIYEVRKKDHSKILI